MKANFIICFFVLIFNISKAQIPTNFNLTDIPIETNSNLFLGECAVAIGIWDPAVVFIGSNIKIGQAIGQAVYLSLDGGITWSPHPQTNNNYFVPIASDPSLVIDRNKTLFFNYLASQVELLSSEKTLNYSLSNVLYGAISTGNTNDKNYVELDDRPTELNTQIYSAWMNGSKDMVVRSGSVNGQTINWNVPLDITGSWTAIPNASHWGVNVAVAPTSDAYASWGIVSGSQATAPIKYIGFAKSTDKFATQFTVDKINNLTLKGINHSLSTPVLSATRMVGWVSLAINQQNKNIFVAWPNFGPPCDDNLMPIGCNTNTDTTDIYFIKSTDDGATWSTPKLVYDINSPSYGKKHWNSVVACDPYTGYLGILYYTVDAFNKVDVYLALSVDEGATWTEQQISDIPFNALPPNKAIVDYISLKMNNGLIIPVWSGLNPLNSNHQTVLTQPIQMDIAPQLNLCSPVTPYYEIVKAQNDIVLSDAGCGYEVLSGAYINYYTGNSIKMATGFHASHGSKIHTHIETIPSPFNAHLRELQNENLRLPIVNKLALTVMPNPVTDLFNSSCTNEADINLTLKIFDVYGNLVKMIFENRVVLKGTSYITLSKKDLDLKAGIYICLGESNIGNASTKIVCID
nr:exo-alpha-sialidase [Bacteroidota bacterium]